MQPPARPAPPATSPGFPPSDRSRQHVLTSFETAVTGPRSLPALTRGRPCLAAWLRATVETTLAA
eukprot:1733291-Prymnesium_polylepis.1